MLISHTRALKIVFSNVGPLKSSRLPLLEAVGRCLAEDVRADRDLPPTDRSAMDGYAVRAADVRRAPRQLRLVGEVAAGSSNRPRVTSGTCVRILTGGSVPPGADAVVRLEETKEENGVVTFLTPAKRGRDIRKRGEEVRRSGIVLRKGTVLGPAQSGLCASVGKIAVRVYDRPRPTVLCTGHELFDPASKVRPHQLRDANGPALQAALSKAGYGRVSSRIVPDDPEVLAERLSTAAAEHEVVIVTGGVSVGKYDFVLEAIERIGGTVRFHGVRMKPGRPQLYATLSGNRHIFGLPGNPVSVLTGFTVIVLPALRRMSGLPVGRCRTSLRLPLAMAVKTKGKRTEYVLARLLWDDNGTKIAPISSKGSADLVAASKADGLCAIPSGGGGAAAGQAVDFRLWRSAL